MVGPCASLAIVVHDENALIVELNVLLLVRKRPNVLTLPIRDVASGFADRSILAMN